MSGSDSLHELYDASYGRLVLQLYALCGDLADAEDAVQEAFVKAIGQGRGFARVQNPEAWLRTVALNQLRNSWRHAKVVRRFVASVPGRPATTPSWVRITSQSSKPSPSSNPTSARLWCCAIWPTWALRRSPTSWACRRAP